MTGDRRSHDPYAPHMPAPVTVPEPKPKPEETVAPTGRADTADLENLTKTELIIRAEHYGLPTYGTKSEIAERLRIATGA